MGTCPDVILYRLAAAPDWSGSWKAFVRRMQPIGLLDRPARPRMWRWPYGAEGCARHRAPPPPGHRDSMKRGFEVMPMRCWLRGWGSAHIPSDFIVSISAGRGGGGARHSLRDKRDEPERFARGDWRCQGVFCAPEAARCGATLKSCLLLLVPFALRIRVVPIPALCRYRRQMPREAFTALARPEISNKTW